ncbi:MAG: hypothetical protein AAFQ80_10680 [Cyanobacteria bacterium J06621_8]
MKNPTAAQISEYNHLSWEKLKKHYLFDSQVFLAFYFMLFINKMLAFSLILTALLQEA